MAQLSSIIRARGLRRASTPAETILWSHLRERRLAGLKFRRQHPIGGYITDFYCAERSLVVEFDGSVHQDPEQREYDHFRDTQLQEHGLLILRFTNDEVETALDSVLKQI